MPAVLMPAPDALPLRRAIVYVVLLAAAFFAAVAPTVRWSDFTGGNENIVVETALEIRRDGASWLLPTMLGEPRVKKPPLVAWIVAASLRQKTIDELAVTDNAARRDAAYRDLAFQARWTAVLAGCGMILATFALALPVLGRRDAVIAAAVVGTLLLLQRYVRQNTTDVHLMLWVAVTNAALAHGLLRRQWTWAAPLAGAALGVAFLCKGPVALVQTLAPAAVFAIARMYFWSPLPVRRERARVRAEREPADSSQEAPTLTLPRRTGRGDRRRTLLSFALAAALFTLIALPWFIYVLIKVPGVAHTWFVEVNREGATNLEPSNPVTYLQWIPMSWPWLVPLLVSGPVVLQMVRRRPEWLLPVLQLWVPLLIMVFFRDRKERYTLPMVAPVAVLCAIGIGAMAEGWAKRLRGSRAILAAHWAVLAIVAVGMPIVASVPKWMPDGNGGAWLPTAVAAPAAAALSMLLVAGILTQSRAALAFVATSFVAMLVFQAVLQFGYARSVNGRSPLRQIADAVRLAAGADFDVIDYASSGRRIDEAAAIYFDRNMPQQDPDTLALPTQRPQVWLTRQTRRNLAAGEPPVARPGWTLVASAWERENLWQALVRWPAPPAQAP